MDQEKIYEILTQINNYTHTLPLEGNLEIKLHKFMINGEYQLKVYGQSAKACLIIKNRALDVLIRDKLVGCYKDTNRILEDLIMNWPEVKKEIQSLSVEYCRRYRRLEDCINNFEL